LYGRSRDAVIYGRSRDAVPAGGGGPGRAAALHGRRGYTESVYRETSPGPEERLYG
jgi:hypothetical protein